MDSNSRKSTNAIEIVISRYNENLEWLKDAPFNKYPVVCYNKGINDNFYKPDNMKIVTIKNVGRESHTYLYHIIHNYDTLAKITIFLPGSCSKDYNHNMFYKYFRAKHMINEIEKHKSAVFVGIYEHYGIKNRFNDYTLESYCSTDFDNQKINSEKLLDPSEDRPYGKWYEKHFGNIYIPYYNHCGIFSINDHNVREHPKSYYEDKIIELSNHSNPEVGHYYERSWVALFYPFNDVIMIDQYRVLTSEKVNNYKKKRLSMGFMKNTY